MLTCYWDFHSRHQITGVAEMSDLCAGQASSASYEPRPEQNMGGGTCMMVARGMAVCMTTCWTVRDVDEKNEVRGMLVKPSLPSYDSAI